MRVLLANPAYRLDLGKGWERYFFCAGSRCPWSLVKRSLERPRYAMFPFFLAYCAAVLREDGFEVAALDGVPLNLSTGEFEARVRAARPDVVVLEPATVSSAWVAGLAARIKSATGARIVLAGAHASACRLELLRQQAAVDHVVAGEYEFPCRELLRRLREGRNPEGAAGVSGRRADGSLYDGGFAEPLTDLARLPFPARDLFPSGDEPDLGLYHDGFCQARPAVQMHSSRGCPFACTFCVLPQVLYRGAGYRCFPASRVVNEMETVVREHGAREIYFDDDTFTGSRAQVHAICDELDRRRVRVPWSAMGDAMTLDEATLERMAGSGCVGLKFGLESVAPEVLRGIGKPLRPETLDRLCRRAGRLGLKTHVSVSFGHLDDTEATIRRTLRFSCHLEVDSVQYSIATPYPGTRFYHEAEQRGLLVEPQFSQYDPWHNAVVAPPHVARRFLERFQAGAHRRWLVRKLCQPGWVLRQVRLLRRVARGQGMRGLRSRVQRGLTLLCSRHFR